MQATVAPFAAKEREGSLWRGQFACTTVWRGAWVCFLGVIWLPFLRRPTFPSASRSRASRPKLAPMGTIWSVEPCNLSEVRLPAFFVSPSVLFCRNPRLRRLDPRSVVGTACCRVVFLCGPVRASWSWLRGEIDVGVLPHPFALFIHRSASALARLQAHPSTDARKTWSNRTAKPVDTSSSHRWWPPCSVLLSS